MPQRAAWTGGWVAQGHQAGQSSEGEDPGDLHGSRRTSISPLCQLTSDRTMQQEVLKSVSGGSRFTQLWVSKHVQSVA